MSLVERQEEFECKGFSSFPYLFETLWQLCVPPAVSLRNYVARGMYVFGIIRKINTDGHGLCVLLRCN